MAIFKAFNEKIAEESSGQLKFTLTDETGLAGTMSAGALTTMTLTLYLAEVLTIINGRNKQNVLNANDVVIDGSGVVTWTIKPADQAIIGSAPTENHLALFEWSWDSGAKKGKYLFSFTITNFDLVP